MRVSVPVHPSAHEALVVALGQVEGRDELIPQRQRAVRDVLVLMEEVHMHMP